MGTYIANKVCETHTIIAWLGRAVDADVYRRACLYVRKARLAIDTRFM